jgi:hypothetical protein
MPGILLALGVLKTNTLLPPMIFILPVVFITMTDFTNLFILWFLFWEAIRKDRRKNNFFKQKIKEVNKFLTISLNKLSRFLFEISFQISFVFCLQDTAKENSLPIHFHTILPSFAITILSGDQNLTSV